MTLASVYLQHSARYQQQTGSLGQCVGSEQMSNESVFTRLISRFHRCQPVIISGILRLTPQPSVCVVGEWRREFGLDWSPSPLLVVGVCEVHGAPFPW